MPELHEWIDGELRYAAEALIKAISATNLVKERSGFGQRIIPRPGSVLASPVLASYDPDPDYFFHWFRDAAIVTDALRVVYAQGLADGALDRFREFVKFSADVLSLDGRSLLARGNIRQNVKPQFLQYVRPDAEIASVSGLKVLAEARVQPDGTLDISGWARPQTDGPALHVLTLLRWDKVLAPDDSSRPGLQTLIETCLAFILEYWREPSCDIWEGEIGRYYYNELVHREALTQGAQWLEQKGRSETALACRLAADALLSSLAQYWHEEWGIYRVRKDAASQDRKDALDMAVILGIIHSGRMAGPHSVLDPRAQATLTALEELFEESYAINRNRPASRGPALGRYAGDTYYSGGAYFFSTLGAAEFYFRLASALRSGESPAVTPDNQRFLQRMVGRDEECAAVALADAAVRRGDLILETVRTFTPASGELSEQFDQTTGQQTSAKHLTWSYAAFITAIASRDYAEAMTIS